MQVILRLKPARIVCLFLVVVTVFIPLPAHNAARQNSPAWRYWVSSMGLRESYTRGITVDSRGRVWAQHGDVDRMSQMDGYRLIPYPSPDTPGRVYATAGMHL